MSTIDLSKFTDAEKIVLAEELWDSVAKDEILVSEKTQAIMKKRLERIEDGNATFFSREEIQIKIRQLRIQLDK